MAKLPQTLMRRTNPELRTLPIGGTAYLDPSAMRVTARLDCYLLPTMPFYRQESEVHTLRVNRTAAGFHATVLGNHKWPANATPKSVTGWIPVESVREEYNPTGR